MVQKSLRRQSAATQPSRRRLLLRSLLLGTTVCLANGYAVADGRAESAGTASSQPEVRVASLPPALRAVARFAMLVSDDGKDESASAKSAAQPEDKRQSEDEARRERLRELLGEDIDKDVSTDEKSEDRETSDNNDFDEPFIAQRLPEVAYGRFSLPPLMAVSIDEAPIGNGRIPETVKSGEDLLIVPLPEDGTSRLALHNQANEAGQTNEAWPHLMRPWAAPNTYSHPLYFEDRMLERHGHERWGCMQPIAAGARFFATIPMLPYLTTLDRPCECVYSKGYYRAGSCVPRFYQRPPLERRAVVTQAAATAGAFLVIP